MSSVLRGGIGSISRTGGGSITLRGQLPLRIAIGRGGVTLTLRGGDSTPKRFSFPFTDPSVVPI
jgi:hypothetical protein